MIFSIITAQNIILKTISKPCTVLRIFSICISLRTSSTQQSKIVRRMSLANANGERKVPPSVFYCPYYPLQCDRLMKHRISEDLFVTLMASTVLRCHINNYQCNWSVIGQLYHHTQFGAFTKRGHFSVQ